MPHANAPATTRLFPNGARPRLATLFVGEFTRGVVGRVFMGLEPGEEVGGGGFV